MPPSERITAVDWRTLERIFESFGFVFRRQKGSHRIYVKAGCHRPIVMPAYGDVGPDIILNNLRTAGIDRAEYLRRLREL